MTNEKIILKPEYLKIGQKVWFHLKHKVASGKKYVIGISGESGSGKSVTAKALQAEISSHGIASLVLSMDNYFLLPPKANHQARLQNISNVGPQEVNLPNLQAHIEAFKTDEKSVSMPLTNYETDSFDFTEVSFQNISILLVEGTYIASLQSFDCLIFMERTYKQTYAQRAERNRDEMNPFIEQVLAIEHEIVRQGKALADIVINKEYEPIFLK